MSTGRARGKHTQRPAIIDPDSPEGRGIGMSDRVQGTPSPIPGGKVHIDNPTAVRQRTPVPDSPAEIKDINAHGMDPGTHTARDRADTMRGPNEVKPLVPEFEPVAKDPVPVPVRIVQDRRAKVLRTSSHRKITTQASTGEPVRLCGQDFNRVKVLLINESSSSDVRFAQRPSDLVNGSGTLLPWPMNSYLSMDTQDELWAISADSGTPAISVIQQFEMPWGGEA